MNLTSDKDITTDVLSLLLRNIRFCGIEKTVKTLQDLDSSNDNEQKEQILKFALRICANNYSVSKQDIMKSSKRGAVKEARKMLWAILKYESSFSNAQIAEIWDLSVQNVGSVLSSVDVSERSSSYSKSELEFKERYEALRESVLVYQNNIKS